MLRHLVIHNVALIDKVELELNEGMNILTGETGAGKSVIIGSLSAILGERVSRDMIRTGSDKAFVEAVFNVNYESLSDIYENLGIEPKEDGTLVISREFSVSGKNICRVNGRMVTLSVLKEIGERLVDIHGQHDNQSLLKTEKHIELLDSFGGAAIEKLKYSYREILSEYKSIKDKIKKLSGDEAERSRKIDILRYQLDEINAAELKPGEDAELEKQRNVLSNVEKILISLTVVHNILNGADENQTSVLDMLRTAGIEMQNAVKWDDTYEDTAAQIDDITYRLEDIADEIRRKRDSMEYNPEMLEQIEDRLDIINKLKRKYGNTIEDIIKFRKDIECELEQMEGSEELLAELQKKLNEVEEQLYRKACELSNERRKAAEILESRITEQLEDLEMKKARFAVNFEFADVCDNNSRNYMSNGLDKIEFLISTNPGEPLKPLARIASGGEMSRIMLAIKTILADVDKVPTLIFDEVDTGISGKAAQKVAEKLALVSCTHQTICITHVPQIACMADNHYLIQKAVIKDTTRTRVKKLEQNDKLMEIARILDGDNITDITMKHAEEMIRNAQLIKNKLK